MKKKTTFVICSILTFFLLGFMISLQLKNVNASNLQSYYAEQDLVAMQDQVKALLLENGDLSDENQKLSDLISSMGADLAGDNKALQAIMEEKSKAEVFAGLTDVSGSGIQIMMDPGTDVSVNSRTLLLFVNELRSSGALAICINDDRIAAMTEIRDTGSDNPQIVINGNSYPASSQFTIKAIYNKKDINRGLQLIDSLVDQLGTVTEISVSSSDEIQIPALSETSLANHQS